MIVACDRSTTAPTEEMMNMRDLDWSDVHADAMNDPTLNRPCEEGAECTDKHCPLIHPGDD